MRILVAMSGGVDSSVVAHLLREQGHDLIGVMMKLWTDPLAPPVQRAIPTKCCSIEHIERARGVCRKLGIPFYVLNLEEEFKKQIVDPFIEGYRKGRTPNPCIECNREIKFGKLLTKAEELGCDVLATGHYARIAKEQTSNGESRHVLLQAIDTGKDQSYYLYTLTQEKLGKILLPLGGMMKEDVYALADTYHIPIHEAYRESQDLCFFPERTPDAFLRRYVTDATSGKIKTKEGEVVGEHRGLPFYTIGQRRGLKIGGLKIPLHVVNKNFEQNEIEVAPSGEDLRSDLQAERLTWISWKPQEDAKIHFEARVHSLGNKERGILTYRGSVGHFRFERGIRGIAPGQALVLYREKEVVGGGTISE